MKKSLIYLVICLLCIELVPAQSFAKERGQTGRHRQTPTRHQSDSEELPDRNHGTGVRFGTAWANAQSAFRGNGFPRAFEFGAFHQHALSSKLSVQIEGLFYHAAPATGGASSGFRLPALLVFNPFYNVSLHLGPQLQWRTSGTEMRIATSADDATEPLPAQSAARATTAVVVGGEARVGFVRIGLRYGLPIGELYDLGAAGRQVGQAWQAGQVQTYIGASF
jgi:hypothetical protein